jgi:hypothetical protein
MCRRLPQLLEEDGTRLLSLPILLRSLQQMSHQLVLAVVVLGCTCPLVKRDVIFTRFWESLEVRLSKKSNRHTENWPDNTIQVSNFLAYYLTFIIVKYLSNFSDKFLSIPSCPIPIDFVAAADPTYFRRSSSQLMNFGRSLLVSFPCYEQLKQTTLL